MKRLTTDEFISRSKAIHGDKYDYSRVTYQSMETNVILICPEHGEFMQTPNNHLKGHGCSICNKIEKRRLSLDEFIEKSKSVHGDRFDYSHVSFVNTKTKVDIICKTHGVFRQTPEKHFLGHGCPYCAANYRDTKESFISKARLIHGNLYDYSKVIYINSSTKVCIIDKKFGEFWQVPNAHLNGEGHPLRRAEKCYLTKKQNNSFHTSKPEHIVKSLLVNKFGEANVRVQCSTDKYPFACDFYITSLDLYIELNIFFTHCGHWFDRTNEKDITYLNMLRSKAKYRNLYAKAIDVWTESDLQKRNAAVANDLNYLVFWKYDLSDFMAWYDLFDETHTLKCF